MIDKYSWLKGPNLGKMRGVQCRMTVYRITKVGMVKMREKKVRVRSTKNIRATSLRHKIDHFLFLEDPT